MRLDVAFSLYVTRGMWRIVGFTSALALRRNPQALTVGGIGWVVFQLFIAEEFSSNLIVAAVIVLAMGAHWLWTDYVKPSEEGDA